MSDPASVQNRFVLPPAFLLTLRSAAGLPGVEGVGGGEIPPNADSWEEAVRAPLRRAGCLMRDVELDPAEVSQAAHPGVPLVSWSADTDWIAVLDGSERSVRVAGPGRREDSLSPAELWELLGREPRKWIAIEPGLAPIKAEGGDHPRPFRRLVEIVRPERGDVLAIVLYAAFVGLLSLTIPIAVQQLVNTVAFGGLVQPVVVVALMLLLGLAIAASFSAFQAYLSEIVQRRVFVRACLDLAERLPRVAPGTFEGRSATGFVNRFFDLVTLQKMGAKLLIDGSGVILQASTGLLILSFYHPLMLGLSVVLFGTMAVVSFTLGRHAPRTALRESTAKYELAYWMEELVRHDSVFRTTAGRSLAAERADALASSWVAARRHHYRTVFRQLAAALGLQVVVNSLVLALGGFLVVAGELTLGQLVASEIIVAAVVAAFARLARYFESYYDVLAAVEKVGGMIDLPLEPGDQPQPRGFEAGAASVEASELSCSRGGERVLEEVSLRLEPGDRAALVADSEQSVGVLLETLAGLRTPASGWVALEGEDLRNRLPQDVADDVALLRGAEILPATIRENLTVARREATTDELRGALDAVGLLQAVRALPDGMDAMLGPDGFPLSRSQSTLLVIARALVAGPRLVLIDDTSLPLDPEVRKPALDALLQPAAPWTVLVASRDQTVLEQCDATFRLEGGRLHQDPRSDRS